MQRVQLVSMFPSQGGSIDEMIILEDLAERLKLTDEYRSQVNHIGRDEKGAITIDHKKMVTESWDDELDVWKIELSEDECRVIKSAGELALKQNRFPRSLAKIWNNF